MKEDIKRLYDEWTNPPFDTETIEELKSIQDDENELIERFYKRLEFGTGGLRGVLGAGINRMNIYTVGMATQGLANYIIEKGVQSKGVVISYDSRRMSDTFSKDTASILAANGIKCYLFDELTPTPLCSFAIRELNATSGIMITASHNPPKYNGYKVYWDDGGQVIPPHDKAIIDEVNKITDINDIKRTDYDKALSDGIITIIGDDIRSKYSAELDKVRLKKSGSSDIKVAYTPLHGTGYKMIPEILKSFGFENVFTEPDQSIPDGNFPTVSYPNPEEANALKLVIELAKKNDADILLATDPDADRMGVGFKKADGSYRLINGNQIGTMLEYYLLSRMKENGTLPKNGSVIKTIVTTELQSEVAESFGLKTEDVLTGFKWIAAKMKEYDESGKSTFVFGGEESYGYLPVNFVRDKDSVSACYFFCEMADWLKSKNSTLEDFLNQIYIENNLYIEDLKSLTFEGKSGMEKIKNIMAEFRNNPLKEFAGVSVDHVDDIQSLKRTFINSSSVEDINDLPSSNVLQYFLSDGTKITMRPSGTEPKIKFYFSAKRSANKDNLEEKRNEIETLINKYKNWISDKAEAID